ELLIPSIEFVANSLGFVTGNAQSSSQINSTFILPTTLTGLVRNALSHLVGCQNKSQYSLGLIRGLGANVNEQLQNEIIQFISKKTGLQLQGSGEKGVKSHAPLSLTLSPDNKRLISFEDNCRQPDVEGVLQAENGELLLNTSEAQTIQSLFIPWIENGNHFLLVGPEGSGKHMLLRETLNKLVTGGGGAEIAEVNCSTQTSANTLADAIKQHSIVLSSAKGRILRPRRGQRLVLFLSDLHLPRADKYDTVEPVAFAQQLVTYGGFFDTDLEWTIVEGVQVIVTIVGKDSGSVNEGNDGIGGNDNQSSSSSSSQSSDSLLSPRFVANVRVASVPHPRQSSLTTVYTNMIEAITKQLRHRQINSSQLSQAMVELYTRIQKQFTIAQHTHYCFTPRDLTRWVVGLGRYDTETSGLSSIVQDLKLGGIEGITSTDDQDSLGLILAWIHEALRIFRDRLDNKTPLPSSMNDPISLFPLPYAEI
ncbi:MAG: putative Cytoplasmic dynein 2 heavy chain 1, partial [Streblomastix strix]